MNHFLLVVSLFVSSASFAQCDHRTGERPVILVVGDSLSSAYGIDVNDGWVSLLKQRLDQKSVNFKVINASVSGDTTRGGLTRLKQAIPKHQPSVVVIELGGNDGLRGQPLTMMRSNLSKMIELTLQNNAVPVVLGMRIPSNYGAKYADAFHQTFAKLAKEYDIAHVDFFLDGVAINPKFIQPDGIHPNEVAQVRMLENAWPAISSAVDTCQQQFTDE